MEEIWKDVKGLEGYYKVSNYGMVKRLEREYTDSNGVLFTLSERVWPGFVDSYYHDKTNGKRTKYYRIALFIDKVRVRYTRTHRLVAEAFLGDPTGMEIDHIDHNGLNNRVDNLRIVTRRGNQSYKKDQGKSKFIGVVIQETSPNKKRTYLHISSRIWHDNKSILLGYYKTEEDAYFCYLWALAMIEWGMPERIFEYKNNYYKENPTPRYIKKWIK